MTPRHRTPRRHHPSTALSVLLAFCVLGSLALAGAAAGSGNRGSHSVGGHRHGGQVSHGRGHHGFHGRGHHGLHGRGHHGGFSAGVRHGLRGYGVRYVAGPFGSYRNFSVTGAYRSYGGFRYRTYPSYRFHPAGSVYSYPVSYAPVADPSVYATPGSVYDPVYQRGVAAQPLGGYYDGDYYDDGGYYYDGADPQPQPIYIIVQPAAAGSQQPVQTQQQPTVRQPVAQARPYHPLAVSGGEAGQVFLSVHPSNAAVYLDDDLLGSGDSLSESLAPFVLDSGVHVLEVVHPQYPPQRLVFGMPSEGRLLIEFDLEGDRRGRKAKVTELDE
jgi:hypothetical protein